MAQASAPKPEPSLLRGLFSTVCALACAGPAPAPGVLESSDFPEPRLSPLRSWRDPEAMQESTSLAVPWLDSPLAVWPPSRRPDRRCLRRSCRGDWQPDLPSAIRTLLWRAGLEQDAAGGLFVDRSSLACRSLA